MTEAEEGDMSAHDALTPCSKAEPCPTCAAPEEPPRSATVVEATFYMAVCDGCGLLGGGWASGWYQSKGEAERARREHDKAMGGAYGHVRAGGGEDVMRSG